jgi:hypothetical protein
MKIFLKILKGFLMFMGVLFILQISLLAYLWFADPFNIRPMMSGQTIIPSSGTSITDQHPSLTSDQENLLNSVGIDPASLPAEIDAETENCLRSKVSPERAAEIEAGATPTPFELIKAKDCF